MYRIILVILMVGLVCCAIGFAVNMTKAIRRLRKLERGWLDKGKTKELK